MFSSVEDALIMFQVRTIQSVSGNVVTLTEALEYEHIGVQSTYGTRTVHFRAEVGHMTRNVKFRGDRNIAFDTKIEACPAGFNMGKLGFIEKKNLGRMFCISTWPRSIFLYFSQCFFLHFGLNVTVLKLNLQQQKKD